MRDSIFAQKKINFVTQFRDGFISLLMKERCIYVCVYLSVGDNKGNLPNIEV